MPGNPTEDSYSYSAMAAMQMGFGAPNSPQYQAAQPRDWAAKGNQNSGNSAFAPSVGIQSQNPLVGLMGNLFMQKILGADAANIRPIGVNNLSAKDFLDARVRSMGVQGAVNDINQANAPYLKSRLGKFGDNLGAQMVYDAFNPGGSQAAAFQSLYGNQGGSFGSRSVDQIKGSMDVLRQMNATFLQKEGADKGGWDFKASRGLDRVETVEGMDAAIRYGIGGASAPAFAKAVKDGKAGQMMTENNKIFDAAKQTFGAGKSMEEYGQLIRDATDGMSNMDPTKTADLLNKIQATSRVIDMSSKAFSEYSGLIKQMYASAGIRGVDASNGVMRSAKDASISTQLGKDTGDAALSDLNNTMESHGRNRVNLARSGGMKQLKALASIASNMTAEQRSATIIKGMGSLADIMKPGGVFQKMMESGDSGGLSKLIRAANESDNPLLGKGAISNKARNLTSEDDDKANKIFDFSKTGDINGANLRKNLSKGIASKMGSDIMSKIGKDGIDKIMGKMDSFAEAGSREKVFDTIKNKLGGMGLDEKQQQMLAAKFSEEMSVQTGNVRAMSRFGFKSRNDANAAFSVTGERGQEMSKEKDRQIASEVNQQKFLSQISGDVMRPFGMKEGANMVLNIAKDYAEGKIKDKDILGEDGKWDAEKVAKLGKAYLKEGAKIDDMKGIMAATSEESMRETEMAGQKAFDKVRDSGGNIDAAEKAREKARSDKTREIFEKAKKASEEEGEPNSLDEEGVDPSKAMKKSGDIDGDKNSPIGKAPKSGGEGPLSGTSTNGSGKEFLTRQDTTNRLLGIIADSVTKNGELASASSPKTAPAKPS